MPLSEFLRLAIEKLEASKKKSCSTDQSSRTENNLVEVIWKDSPNHDSLSPTTPSVGDATLGSSTAASLGGVDSIFNDISPVVHTGELDLSQNDEVVPCLSYPVDDGLQDFFSKRLPEISGVTAKGTSGGKESSCDQAVSNLDNGQYTFKFSSCKARSLCSWPPLHGPTSDPSRLSEVSGIITNNRSNSQDGKFGNCAQIKDVVGNTSSMKMESQNLLNLSSCSRPATTVVKVSLPIYGGVSSLVSSGTGRMEVKENGPASRCSNPLNSMLIEQLNTKQKNTDLYVASAPAMVKSRQLLVKERKESFHDQGTDNFCKDTFRKTDKVLTQNNTTNSTTVLDGDRILEPVVASSSVGSGNSADRVSYEETHDLKRKFCDNESECHSDDIQTESVGVKKPTPALGDTGPKRSRTAEVHNLSERRRRDRINEKMRALQELIPNCNKADKASMLDEAIQYLKNLQHQVQVYEIMFMGAGLCVPPMMFPPGSQHMYPAPIPHFSPMGVGMGMGLSFGNINHGSPQCPIFPVPSIQGPHFPSSPLGHANLQGTSGPNLPILGHLYPGFQSAVPRTPSIPLTGSHPSSALRISSQNVVPSTSSNLNSEEPRKSKNSRNMQNAKASSSINRA